MRPRASAIVPPSAATSRLLAALAISALIHCSLPLVVSGGSRRAVSAAGPALFVRVMPEPRVPESSPAPEKLAIPQEKIEQRERRASSPDEAHVVRPSNTPPAEASRPAGSVPEAPDLTYYAAKQLDVYPRLATALDLKYRGKAADDGVTGRALLLVLIDEIGTVKDVSIVEAEPPDYFEEDAKRAFSMARFTPAIRNGRAVRSRVLIEVNYGVERGSP